jgi:hypothetical protein
MHEYYQKTLTCRATCVATIVDPRYKDQTSTWFEDSRGDSIRMHKKAIDRCNKETYHRYQTHVSEINTFERLNQEEETRAKIERDPQNRQDPFFEFEDKRANAVKPELERYLEEPLIPCDLKTSHLDRVEILVKQAIRVPYSCSNRSRLASNTSLFSSN